MYIAERETGIDRRQIAISTLVLLLAAAILILHAGDTSLWEDEFYTVHHISGRLDQLLLDRELNWPPLYYLPLYVWMRLAGPHDVILRMTGVFYGLLGTTCFFQIGRRLGGRRTGWLAALLFATSSYTLYFLLELRGYALLLPLIGLVLWLHLRWLSHPTWRRALFYVVGLVALWYTQYAALIITVILGGHVLLTAPRRLLRWLPMPLVAAAAFLPLWGQFIEAMQVRAYVFAVNGTLPAYFLQGPEMMFRAYSGGQPVLFVMLILLVLGGLVLLMWRGPRSVRLTVLWLAGWGLAVPALAYLLRARVGLYTERYLTFTVPGLIVLLALGLGALPVPLRRIGVLLVLASAVFAWQPFHFRPAYSDSPPIRDLVRELADRLAPGEVLVVDPGCTCGDPLGWWYYESLYMPGGRAIPRVTDPADAPGGVWYLSRQGSRDAALQAAVADGRLYTEFWGPWYFIVEHYEAPPLVQGYRVGETIRFQGASFVPRGPYMPGDVLTVRTWWAVDAPPERDYSLGLHLLDASGRLVAQVDSGPVGDLTPGQTSAWQPGELYRDDRVLQIPWRVPMGRYVVLLFVYYWEDGLPLPLEEAAPQRDGGLLLGTAWVDTWAGYGILPH